MFGKKRKLSNERFYLVPAVVIVAICTQIPFIFCIVYSFTNWNLTRPDKGITFAGLKNYIYFLTDAEFWKIALQTAVLVIVSLVVCTFLGYLIALLLDHDIPGKRLFRTMVITPFFLMTTASGVIWKYTIFNISFGWYGEIVRTFGGVPSDPLTRYPMASLILIFIWQWMPFFIMIYLGGLQGISEEVVEIAKIDGCNWWVLTFKIKLPMIFNYLQVAMMLGFVFIMKELGLIVTTTLGGPGTSTYTFTYEIYKQMTVSHNVGRTAAVSVIVVVIILICIKFLFSSMQKRKA